MFLAQLERSLEPLCRYIEAPVYGSIKAGRVSCISFAKVFADRLQVGEVSRIGVLRAKRLNHVVQEGELPEVQRQWLDR